MYAQIIMGPAIDQEKQDEKLKNGSHEDREWYQWKKKQKIRSKMK